MHSWHALGVRSALVSHHAAHCSWHNHFTQLLQVLNVAFLLVGALCTLMGAAGYYMYGNAVRDVVTFNLPKVPLDILTSACAGSCC